MTKPFVVFLEIGKQRTFAGAIDWPGWCRSGRDEATALENLLAYGPRYARALRSTDLGFTAPADAAVFRVVERLPGNATTDFGAPGAPLADDKNAVDAVELRRLEALLKACWKAFDGAVKAAAGKELRLGPRGGGRDVERMIRHVLESEGAYLQALGGKAPKETAGDLAVYTKATRQAVLASLAASVRGEIPPIGPRGGLRWAPRTFVRRVAWHALDHAWEVEDRILT